MSFQITANPIDLDALRAQVRTPTSGACVLFEGWVRNHHEGRDVARLEYEVYEPLAVKEAERILDEAHAAFGPLSAAAVHREGVLEIGEVAVAVAVSAAHRDEAFRAARFLIDEFKRRLPIWKKEHYLDGDAVWVNCAGCAAAPNTAI